MPLIHSDSISVTGIGSVRTTHLRCVYSHRPNLLFFLTILLTLLNLLFGLTNHPVALAHWNWRAHSSTNQWEPSLPFDPLPYLTSWLAAWIFGLCRWPVAIFATTTTTYKKRLTSLTYLPSKQISTSRTQMMYINATPPAHVLINVNLDWLICM